VARIFEEFRPTDVIHTAAQTQVDLCEQNREQCERVNLTAVEYIAKACRKHNSRLVHLSTDFIFDGEEGPYRESDAPNPVNYYGLCKLRSEEAVKREAPAYAILRTVLVYGYAAALSRSNIVLWAKSSLEAKKTIQVVHDQFRTPTLAEDLAQACLLAVMKQAQGVYHISGAEQMSILELVQRVARFWELDETLIRPVGSESLQQPARRPPRTGFLLLKAQTELGYRPHAFEAGLEIVDRQMRNAKEA
jgi:dTDP-4-dehydrorhamnose reductase